jgi:outer membrane protein assembly factor BamB
MPSTSRRALLGTLAVGATVGVAGCSSSCPDDGTPEPSVVVDATDAADPFETRPDGVWPSPRFDAGNTGHTPARPPTDAPALRWRTALPARTVDGGGVAASSPTVADGRVYVTIAGGVVALSLRDGTERWRHETTPATIDPAVGYDDELPPPVVADGRVYLSTTDGVVALHADDGAVAWRATDAAATGVPTVHGDGLLVPTADGLAGLDARDGRRRWLADVAATLPAVAEGTVVGGDEATVALDAASGDRLWSAQTRAASHPVVADGTVFLGTDGRLVGLGLDDGRERWTIDRGGGRTFSAPVVTPATAYTVERPGEAGDATFALDRTGDGAPEPRWCSYVGRGAVTAATGGHAFALRSASPDDRLIAFTERFGEATWGYAPGDRALPPAILDGAVVTVTRRGVVAAVGGA